MDETSHSFQSDELSEEDLAIIQAFDALEELAMAGSQDEQNGQRSNSTSLLLLDGIPGIENPEDMLILFPVKQMRISARCVAPYNN